MDDQIFHESNASKFENRGDYHDRRTFIHRCIIIYVWFLENQARSLFDERDDADCSFLNYPATASNE